MGAFNTGFLTGFMSDQAKQITERKDVAEEYFQQQMELAHKKAMSYNTQNSEKLNAATQVANQMMAIGVPKNTVMAIANQNPDDLQTFYDTVQKMQMSGVDMSNPEVYEGLIQIDGEFNPGNENVTSLLQRVYNPLTNNAKADPEGWDFDPKGSIWSTMLGYNAMDSARARLGSTEVLPGVSAQQVLSQQEEGVYGHPLGNNAVTLNAPVAGTLSRAAADANRGGDELSVGERSTILSNYEKAVETELLNDTASGLEGPQKEAAARKRAAGRILQDFPEAANIPQITRYLGDGGEEAAPVADAPTAPAGAPTAPTPVEASQAPEEQGQAPQALPDGSTLEQDLGDGTVVYIRNGKPTRYTKKYVMQIMSGAAAMKKPGPTMQGQPTPGWLENQGSEYD